MMVLSVPLSQHVFQNTFGDQSELADMSATV
jgi:hypothetical protein